MATSGVFPQVANCGIPIMPKGMPGFQGPQGLVVPDVASRVPPNQQQLGISMKSIRTFLIGFPKLDLGDIPSECLV